LALPHRQFIFTFPRILRLYFRHNHRLFSEISRLIFAIIERFYAKGAKRKIKTGMVLAYQSSGEFLKFNLHFHCLVLEGGRLSRISDSATPLWIKKHALALRSP
jgi:hypothetical protein